MFPRERDHDRETAQRHHDIQQFTLDVLAMAATARRLGLAATADRFGAEFDDLDTRMKAGQL